MAYFECILLLGWLGIVERVRVSSTSNTYNIKIIITYRCLRRLRDFNLPLPRA